MELMKLIEILLFLLLTLPPQRPTIVPEKLISTPQPIVKAVAYKPITDSLVRLVNVERAKSNLYSLVEDKRLFLSASQKACDMRDKDYFSHENYISFSLDGKPIS